MARGSDAVTRDRRALIAGPGDAGLSLTEVTPSRWAAYRIRSEVARGLRLDVAFGRVADSLPPRERAFVHELSYGVSRLRGRLDHLVDRRLRMEPDRLDARVREVLRLGAYQLLYMGSVPPYAAVSQTAELARRVAGEGSSGLVNAVLRSVAADGDGAELFPDPETDPTGHLATWGSHPRWLLERWLARWDARDVRMLVEADNSPPVLHLVPLESTAEETVRSLAAAGIAGVAVGEGTDCIRLEPGTDPLAALAVLPSIIQDPGSNLVTKYADVARGTKVADLCAAPGGKALALSTRASYTLAADRSETRMRMVRDNARRTGRRLGMAVADALRPPLLQAPVVLLDVPCSGTGTLRRHPDGRWRLAPKAVVELAGLQRRLLDAAAPLVAAGGLLVYATCTLEPEENAQQVAEFLERHRDFRLDPSFAVASRFLDAAGHLAVLPHHTGFDGAFAARFRRAA